MESNVERAESGAPTDDEARRLVVRRVAYALMLAPLALADVGYLHWIFGLPRWLSFGVMPATFLVLYGFAVTCIHGFVFALVVGDPEPEKNGPHPIRRTDAWIGTAVVVVFWVTPIVYFIGSYGGVF